jgi:putative SOS response-associated peptidase YedK
MCGRFTLTVDASELQAAFPWAKIPDGSIRPRFNIAPTQPVAVIPNDGKDKLDFFVWGLIPSWAKDPSIGSKMINARAETLAEKPSFRTAYKRRRCLILADGFYEWQQIPGSKSKIPLFIHMADRRPFALAGLWETWWAGDGSEVRSCTIITTEPNEMMRAIHNRMPVILSVESYPMWLSAEEISPAALQPLLVPYSAQQMTAYPVSRAVNSPSIDSAELIQQIHQD